MSRGCNNRGPIPSPWVRSYPPGERQRSAVHPVRLPCFPRGHYSSNFLLLLRKELKASRALTEFCSLSLPEKVLALSQTQVALLYPQGLFRPPSVLDLPLAALGGNRLEIARTSDGLWQAAAVSAECVSVGELVLSSVFLMKFSWVLPRQRA